MTNNYSRVLSLHMKTKIIQHDTSSVYQNIFLTSTKTFWALAYFQFLAQLHTLPYNLIQFLCGKRPLFFGDPPHNKIKTIIFHFIYFQFLNTVVEKGNRDLVIFSKPLNLSYSLWYLSWNCQLSKILLPKIWLPSSLTSTGGRKVEHFDKRCSALPLLVTVGISLFPSG